MLVSDEKIAGLLSHGAQTIQMLAPFLGFESTTKNAALESGVKLNVMAYWVQKYFEAGILVRTKTEKRTGSPIHYYRAVADEFLIPTELIRSTSSQELLERTQLQEYRNFSAGVVKNGLRFAPRWCLYYYRDEKGQNWTFQPLEPPETTVQPPIHNWYHLELAPEHAANLRHDLEALRDKYWTLRGVGENRKRHTLHLGLVED